MIPKLRDPKFTSVFDSNSLLCVIVFELVWFKSICLYSFQKELDLTLTTVATIHMFRKISSPGNIGSGTSPSVFIFERIVILCFVSFLYIVKNFIQASQFFFVWEECMEKKKLEIKHSLGPETCALQNYALTWKVGDEWSLNDSFFITWVNDLYVRYTSETWNLQCQLICVYSLWVDDFFFYKHRYLPSCKNSESRVINIQKEL